MNLWKIIRKKRESTEDFPMSEKFLEESLDKFMQDSVSDFVSRGIPQKKLEDFLLELREDFLEEYSREIPGRFSEGK